MTVTINLPEKLASQLTALYPEETERERAILFSIAEAVQAQQQDTDSLIAEMEEIIADVETGRNTVSFEEVCRLWDAEEAAQARLKLQ